ncbi:MAG: hypothetical protein AB7U20_02535, partial [Planctomycetaceae bacterium]
MRQTIDGGRQVEQAGMTVAANCQFDRRVPGERLHHLGGCSRSAEARQVCVTECVKVRKAAFRVLTSQEVRPLPFVPLCRIVRFVDPSVPC